VPSKLASYLSAAIDEANSKSTVSEWLAALSLSESGAAEWLNDEGPYEDMEDVKELEEEEKQALIAATKRKNGGEMHAVRVAHALAALAEKHTDAKEHETPEKLTRENTAREKTEKEKADEKDEKNVSCFILNILNIHISSPL